MEIPYQNVKNPQKSKNGEFFGWGVWESKRDFKLFEGKKMVYVKRSKICLGRCHLHFMIGTAQNSLVNLQRSTYPVTVASEALAWDSSLSNMVVTGCHRQSSPARLISCTISFTLTKSIFHLKKKKWSTLPSLKLKMIPSFLGRLGLFSEVNCELVGVHGIYLMVESSEFTAGVLT